MRLLPSVPRRLLCAAVSPAATRMVGYPSARVGGLFHPEAPAGLNRVLETTTGKERP